MRILTHDQRSLLRLIRISDDLLNPSVHRTVNIRIWIEFRSFVLNGTRRIGVEAALRVDPLRWLGARADLTWVDARFRSSGSHVPGTSPLFGRAALRLGERRGPHGDAELRWTAERRLAHGATAAAYALLDVSAGWRFARFDVTVAVDNATDARRMDGAYHYASWFDRAGPRSGIPAVHFTAGAPLTARLVLTAFL